MAAKELNNTILRNSTNLMAYYRFEAGALTTDDSGNGNTLTNTNTVGEGTGVFGGAADFGSANTNKFLSLGSNLSIGGNGQLSVSFWAKMNTEITTGIQVFFIHNSTLGANRYMQFFYDYNAGSRRFLWDCSGANITKTVALGTTWHHFAMTRPDGDGAVFQAYFDGGCVGTASIGTSPLTRNDVFIGAQTSGANFAASILMDDVAIFNKVLSADEIKELYEGRYIGELSKKSTVKGLWHLSNPSDSSGSNLNLTPIASPVLGDGVFNKAYKYVKTSSQYLRTQADLTPINFAGSTTWMCSFLPSTLPGTSQYLFGIGNVGAIGLKSVYVNDTAHPGMYFSGTVSNVTLASDETVVAGKKYYLVFIWDSPSPPTGTAKVFVNGKWKTSSQSVTINTSWSTPYFTIGCLYDKYGTGTFNYFTNGIIDEVAIYNYAWTEKEVNKWYAWQTGKYL